LGWAVRVEAIASTAEATTHSRRRIMRIVVADVAPDLPGGEPGVPARPDRHRSL
jgi:hypothetical protein